jgi:hypothetical protein
MPSAIPWTGADSSLARRLRDRVRRWVAEGIEHTSGPLAFAVSQYAQGVPHGSNAEIFRLTARLCSINAVEERRNIDHLGAVFEEVKVHHLLSRERTGF